MHCSTFIYNIVSPSKCQHLKNIKTTCRLTSWPGDEGPCGTNQFLHVLLLTHRDLVPTGERQGDCETKLKLEPGRVRSLHFDTDPYMLEQDLCWSGKVVFRQNEKDKDEAVSQPPFTLIPVTDPIIFAFHILFSVKWFQGSLLYSILKLGRFRAKPVSIIIPLAIMIFFFKVAI